MSSRLELIASVVKDGIGVADVGTDHAYIPLILIKNGYKGNIIATDINKGPLDKARLNLSEAECENEVELILCDGLEGCDPDNIDTVIAAGMGGDTITGILDKAEWCSRADIRLILQPVTKPEILRYWLSNNDFLITEELHIEENGTIYQIICAKPGKDRKYSDAELYIGKYELIKDSPYFEKLMQKHIKRFKSAVDGLRRTKRDGLEAWLKLNEGILDEFIEMRRKNNEKSN